MFLTNPQNIEKHTGAGGGGGGGDPKTRVLGSDQKHRKFGETHFYHLGSVQDRTGAAQYYHLNMVVAPPPDTLYSRLVVTTCLYTLALLVAELGKCFHP